MYKWIEDVGFRLLIRVLHCRLDTRRISQSIWYCEHQSDKSDGSDDNQAVFDRNADVVEVEPKFAQNSESEILAESKKKDSSTWSLTNFRKRSTEEETVDSVRADGELIAATLPRLVRKNATRKGGSHLKKASQILRSGSNLSTSQPSLSSTTNVIDKYRFLMPSKSIEENEPGQWGLLEDPGVIRFRFSDYPESVTIYEEREEESSLSDADKLSLSCDSLNMELFHGNQRHHSFLQQGKHQQRSAKMNHCFSAENLTNDSEKTWEKHNSLHAWNRNSHLHTMDSFTGRKPKNLRRRNSSGSSRRSYQRGARVDRASESSSSKSTICHSDSSDSLNEREKTTSYA